MREWQGPSLMDPSTDIWNILRYIRDELRRPWLQLVDLYITGFCPDRFQEEPVWTHAAALNASTNSSFPGHGWLGAIRAEILYRSSIFGTSSIQIMFCAHILQPKSLFTAKSGRGIFSMDR